MKTPLLELKNARKYFPVKAGFLRRTVGQVKAVDGVDIAVYPQEIVGLVGESGSGKSTIGRLAIRLTDLTSGELLWEGKDLAAFSGKRLKEWRNEAQMVFQEPYGSLNPRHTIRESLGEALAYHNLVHTEDEKTEAVAEVLKTVGLRPEMMMRYPHEFSGGQQQRICIGRAISLKPRLIVCDEVVSALDVLIQAQTLNLLMDLQQSLNLSYLFISHDLSLVRHVCDRVVVLYLGKVMESGTAEQIFRDPRHPYTQALLSAQPKAMPGEKGERIVLTGEVPSPRNPPSGCPFRTRCPYAQPRCAEVPPRYYVSGEEDHYYDCILGENKDVRRPKS